MTAAAIQKRPAAVASLNHYLTAKIPQLGEWVKDRIDPAALVRFALFEVQQSEQLQKCSSASIYLALLACAQVGLEPGGVKQEAFIVPYKTTATFQLGWRGIVKLAMRSGEVAKLSANVVHDGDDFDFDLGTESFVRHRPSIKKRGKLIGAYAFAKLKTGELDVEWMNIDDLEKIRKSGHEGPAWRTWADQMYRKAPIRRLGKRLPLGGDYMLGARLDELAEGQDFRGYQQALGSTGVVIDVPIEVEKPKAKNDQKSKRTAKGVDAAKKKLSAKASKEAKAAKALKDAKAKGDLPPIPPPDEPPSPDDEAAAIRLELEAGNASEELLQRIARLPADLKAPLVELCDEVSK